VVVDIDEPLNPRIAQQISTPELRNPRAIAIQFRYGFIVDDDGLKVLDLSAPGAPRLLSSASVPLAAATTSMSPDLRIRRKWKKGIAIIDVEQPEKPRLDQMYDAGGQLNDARQVKVAMTNASLFGYVADGKNGLRILQLTSPETMPEYAGFSPRPKPY